MIVVKVELWPGGDAERAEALGIVAIANRGYVNNEDDLCKYDVELQQAPTSTTKYRIRLKRGHLTHWRRRGWLRLVRLALESVDHHA